MDGTRTASARAGLVPHRCLRRLQRSQARTRMLAFVFVLARRGGMVACGRRGEKERSGGAESNACGG